MTSRPTRLLTGPTGDSEESRRTPGAVRLRVPDDGESIVDDVIRGRDPVPEREHG